jgi:hypothetical protein
MSRIPTEAFGYTYTHLPEFARDDLDSLEREGVVYAVIYADHWIDELEDFRHVRIAFTPEEAKDYARRCWAYELFLRAGSPRWAKDAPGIDADVAHDADTYQLRTKDGEVFPPPYHCFAAFLGEHLEAISCSRVPGRETVIELQGKDPAVHARSRCPVVDANHSIVQFPRKRADAVVGYVRRRRSRPAVRDAKAFGVRFG